MVTKHPAGQTKPPPQHRPEAAAPDTGCSYAPKCVGCPWRTCIQELPAHERRIFVDALRLVRGYLAEPDTVISA